MNPSNEDKTEELKKNLLNNQFLNDNQQSGNSLNNVTKAKSQDYDFRNDSFGSERKTQYHNIYFALLYLISIFIVAISCAYYFCYNNYNNRIFLSTSKAILPEQYPFYKIISKYTKGNCIYIKLQLVETPSINNFENTEQIKNLDAIFEFFLDYVNFKIYSEETKSNLNEEEIFNINDVEYTNSNKKINNYKDSNINITFIILLIFIFKGKKMEQYYIIQNAVIHLRHKINFRFIKIILKSAHKLMKKVISSV